MSREVAAVWMVHMLTKLYDAWPDPIHLGARSTIEETGGEPTEALIRKWDHLGHWLENEGIIFVAGRAVGDAGHLNRTVLTAKGMSALGKPLPGTEKTVGARLGELTREAGGSVAKGATGRVGSEMAELAGSLFGSFVKSVGS